MCPDKVSAEQIFVKKMNEIFDAADKDSLLTTTFNNCATILLSHTVHIYIQSHCSWERRCDMILGHRSCLAIVCEGRSAWHTEEEAKGCCWVCVWDWSAEGKKNNSKQEQSVPAHIYVFGENQGAFLSI